VLLILCTNIYFRFVSISITNNLNRLITCSTIFSDEVLHLHLIAMSSGFQDISGRNSACLQICGICQAANTPLYCHLCLLLCFFVQKCRPFGPFFFRLGILSVQCLTAREKADPSAAAGDSRQRSGWQHSSWGIICVVIPNALLIPVVFSVITFLTISFDINASVIYCSTELPL